MKTQAIIEQMDSEITRYTDMLKRQNGPWDYVLGKMTTLLELREKLKGELK